MFDQTIKQLEREVRDLRTAHTRGLGMINFSSDSITATTGATTYPYYYGIVVYFKNVDVFPPMVEIGSNYGALSSPTFNEQYLAASYRLNAGTSELPTVSVVSSAPIRLITIEALN